MDGVTGYITDQLSRLNLTDKVSVIFLSDHGMREVKVEPEFTINYESIVNSQGKYSNYGSTPLLQILPARESKKFQISKEIISVKTVTLMYFLMSF